jgi:hypothetical protein
VSLSWMLEGSGAVFRHARSGRMVDVRPIAAERIQKPASAASSKRDRTSVWFDTRSIVNCGTRHFHEVINFEQTQFVSSRKIITSPIVGPPRRRWLRDRLRSRLERQRTGNAMGSIHHIGKSFDPEATHAIRAAFDSAWQDLAASGDIFSSQFPADRACGKIARRIINMVQRGERDPDHLSEDALDYLARRTALRGEQR